MNFQTGIFLALALTMSAGRQLSAESDNAGLRDHQEWIAKAQSDVVRGVKADRKSAVKREADSLTRALRGAVRESANLSEAAARLDKSCGRFFILLKGVAQCKADLRVYLDSVEKLNESLKPVAQVSERLLLQGDIRRLGPEEQASVLRVYGESFRIFSTSAVNDNGSVPKEAMDEETLHRGKKLFADHFSVMGKIMDSITAFTAR